MSDEIPWPKKGDVLFTGSPNTADWRLNACVGWTGLPWTGYAEGYKMGADVLVQHVIDTCRSQDFLVYPIVFLYRHALEVSLKNIARLGNALLDEDEKFPGHHDLLKLWAKCKAMILATWPDSPTDDIEAAESVIRQFHEKDHSSFNFRYPTDKTGRIRSIPTNEQINLVNLGEVMNRVYGLLQAAYDGISHNLNEKLEWESYLAQEYGQEGDYI